MKPKIGLWIAGIVILWASTLLIQLLPDGFNAGALGDSFGITNSLFSGLAFALLIYSSWMQKSELTLQREELKSTREELKLAREAHEKHVELVQLQIQEARDRLVNEAMPLLVIEENHPNIMAKSILYKFKILNNDLILNGFEISSDEEIENLLLEISPSSGVVEKNRWLTVSFSNIPNQTIHYSMTVRFFDRYNNTYAWEVLFGGYSIVSIDQPRRIFSRD